MTAGAATVRRLGCLVVGGARLTVCKRPCPALRLSCTLAAAPSCVCDVIHDTEVLAIPDRHAVHPAGIGSAGGRGDRVGTHGDGCCGGDGLCRRRRQQQQQQQQQQPRGERHERRAPHISYNILLYPVNVTSAR